MTTDSATAGFTAPPTHRGDVAEVIHGKVVADPYRWLEDIDTAAVSEWTIAQDAATRDWLDANAPARAEIRERLEQLSAITIWSPAVQRGGRWFATRRNPGADQPVLVVGDDPASLDRVLIDPAEWSADGTAIISWWSPSPDGRLLAFSRSDAGSDWQTWGVLDVDTGERLADELLWSKFSSASWLATSDGFVYAAHDEPDEDLTKVVVDTPRVTLHRIGTAQPVDVMLHRETDPDMLPDAEVSHDGRWLVLTVTKGTERQSVVRALDLASPGSAPIDLVADRTALHELIDVDNNTFVLLTDDTAVMRRLIAIDITDPDRVRHEVIAESNDRIETAHRALDAFVMHLFRDASSALQVRSLSGGLRHEVALPSASSITAISAERDSNLVTLTVTSFTEPTAMWLLDVTSGELRKLQSSGAPALADVTIDRVTAPSADGTPVPMWLIHRSDVVADGTVPTLLYGYGGFDVAITPTWQAERQVWIERGALLAVANLRGGGEFGREWYDAGRGADKQHVFEDAIGCARWLASSGWSRPSQIAITGRSNGGLLAAACLTQAPDAFGAAVPEVGVLDMLRFHKFTIGWAWMSDYGDPESAEGFEWVMGYSPLHRAEAAMATGQSYPPTLITTGDHDDRVMPAHSYKFAAAMQAAQAAAGGSAPILLRVDIAAGHGAGKPLGKQLDERADLLAFLDATIG